MKLKIICSWCKKFMGTKKCERLSLEGLDITHSICPECEEKVKREMDEYFVQNPTTRTKIHLKGGFNNE
jgi:hypothetical protein